MLAFCAQLQSKTFYLTFYLTFVADCHPFYLTEGEIEGEEASKR
jgi:hypothetical protein